MPPPRRAASAPCRLRANTMERGGYDSDGRAVLTLAELQRWLALAGACYHGQVHDTRLRY